MNRVSPAPADGPVCAKRQERKAGVLWKELSSGSWVDAVLAVQAASASYGTPEGPAARQEGGVSFLDLDPERPFPGDDANVEYADLLAECRRCRVQHSCLLDESSTDTQVWVLALAAPTPEQEGTAQQDRLFCSFRGTSSNKDVATDMRYTKVQADEDLKKGWKMLSEAERSACRFHEGFLGQYFAVARALRMELEKAAATLSGDYELVICGHSMGGALANLCSFDLLASGFTRPGSSRLVTIGSGPVGNKAFVEAHDRLQEIDTDARRHLHIVNNNDPVPAAALGFARGGTLSCCVSFEEDFEHSGTLLWVGASEHSWRTLDGFAAALGRIMRRLCTPCTTCCLAGEKISVVDHATAEYVGKLGSFVWRAHSVPMRCLGGNKAVAQGGTVQARTWTGVGTPGFMFPELRQPVQGQMGEAALKTLQSKQNFAICLSGGGFRATSCALGWVRALDREGILRHARYITSNNGGSWFNTAFSYQNLYTRAQFLGEYIEPKDLTLEAAIMQGSAEGSYAKAIADSNFLKDFLVELIQDFFSMDCLREKDAHKVRAWSEAVGKGFLKPFGLDAFNAAYCMSGCEEWTKEQTSAVSVHVACKQVDLPFPVIVGCVAPKGDPRQFHCYEFTPLYSGCPAVIADSPGMKLGGVLVEPFGANCRPPAMQLHGGSREATIELDVVWRVPLVQVAGISSSCIAQMKVDSSKEGLWETMGCPELHIFNGIDGQGTEIPFADGGGVDNTAIHAALRRGVTNVLACYAHGGKLEPHVFWDVAALFGSVPEEGVEGFGGPKMGAGVIPAAVFNKHIQVFEKEQFQTLASSLDKCLKDKIPPVVPMKLNVLPNPTQGIEGGYEAHVIWIFNAMPDTWYNELPEDTKEALKSDECEGFPNLPTDKLNYDPETAVFLSQLASFNMMHAIGDIKQMLT